MKILLAARHRYPGNPRQGAGRQPMATPSGSSWMIHDWLAKGLAELGHEVFYLLAGGADEPLPPGVTLVREPEAEADILHKDWAFDAKDWPGPWVQTCHIRATAQGPPSRHWIYVSRTLARWHDSDRFVHNGIDPADYGYAAQKDDYLLFISALTDNKGKGLPEALRLASRAGVRLLVAGSAQDRETVMAASALCRRYGADYLGDVRGPEKARLLAGARALIFPVQRDEAFGLVLAEALMSGTPVICSANGACPELVPPEVGFVCRTETEYLAAIDGLAAISPAVCRRVAMTRYHYREMAAGYVREYRREIARHRALRMARRPMMSGAGFKGRL